MYDRRAMFLLVARRPGPSEGRLSLAALDGELAVPCTGNPPQPGRIPRRGPASQAGSGWKALKAGTCAARVSEPRQVRKEAAVRRALEGAAAIRAGAVTHGNAGGAAVDEGVRGHPRPPNRSMSTYQTLYRKYRSQTFSDLVGQ